jgi:hypothetical protein
VFLTGRAVSGRSNPEQYYPRRPNGSQDEKRRRVPPDEAAAKPSRSVLTGHTKRAGCQVEAIRVSREIGAATIVIITPKASSKRRRVG